MTYTVCSRGRPIGTTELDFVRIGGPHRMGFFEPNDEGERLIPLVAAPRPAMRARMRRTATDDAESHEMSQEEARLLMAEMREAGEQERALGLTLHRADGSLVATESISFRDTEAYLEIGELIVSQCPPWREDDAEIQRAVEHDLELIEESFGEEDDGYPGFDMPEPDWAEVEREAADAEPSRWKRYQIQIELLDDAEIP